MNVAGRKVGPAEVEDALIEHPAVSEAAVIGIPDELKGEGIVAFVVTKHGQATGKPLFDALAAHLIDSLGPTFRPNAIHAVGELPKNAKWQDCSPLDPPEIPWRTLGGPLYGGEP
jgi:acetyl-CoA synthetase